MGLSNCVLRSSTDGLRPGVHVSRLDRLAVAEIEKNVAEDGDGRPN